MQIEERDYWPSMTQPYRDFRCENTTFRPLKHVHLLYLEACKKILQTDHFVVFLF